jgi:hypothetical protein
VARLRWVPLDKTEVPDHAQRELKQHRVEHIAANLDLEQIGTPTVSYRDGVFYILDGQHRIAALKQFGFESDSIQCWTYEGLTEDEEAEYFLKLNDTLAVDAMSKFRIGVNAGRDIECDIDRVVRAQGMVVSSHRTPGAIAAVGTLRRVYGRGGPGTLSRTLRIIGEAYGDAGLEASVIDGLSLVCQRYNGELPDDVLVERLAAARGGVNGLIQRADTLRRQTGNGKAHCVAAATVEVYNRGRGGRKLPDWWRVNA